jgi:Tropinone reductase 1
MRAGKQRGQLFVKAAAECTADEYSHLMATNLESFFHLSQLARPLLLNASVAGGGSIVNMSSIGGTISYAGAAIYNVTKGMFYLYDHVNWATLYRITI